MKRIFDLLEDIKKLKIIEYFIYLKILWYLDNWERIEFRLVKRIC